MFYYNGSIFRRVMITPSWTLRNDGNISDIPGFNRTLYGLLGRLQNEAAAGDSQLKYATGKADVRRNQTIYAQVQCNPDLTRLGCIQCVQGTLADFPHYVTMPTFMAAGARTAGPSCNLRYELWRFYDKVEALDLPPALAPSSNTSNTTTQGGKNKKSHKAVVILVPLIVGSVILLITTCICIIWRKKKLRKYRGNFDKEEIETLQSLQFSLGAIKVATADFSDDNKLGQGGFGIVYKGKLPDGQEVAVKRLSRNSGQGDVQFKNEILILAKLQHRNLVRLLGFCLEGEEMILIYEFMTNKSLDIFLLDPEQRAFLPWETRYKVINGIARGLQYLHEDSRLRIIHRDLKAGNVLLDGEFNPKIADFGMARLFEMDQTRLVTNKIVGTYGYMPPEYVQHGRVSVKLDVFSFGVLVLEIVSGQMISSFTIEENSENLLSFAWTNWKEGTPWNMVDPALPAASKTEILRCIHIGLLCIQHNPADRPTMSSIALMLSSSSMSLPVPSQPAFFTRRNTYMPDTKGSGMESINEVSMTELYPR